MPVCSLLERVPACSLLEGVPVCSLLEGAPDGLGEPSDGLDGDEVPWVVDPAVRGSVPLGTGAGAFRFVVRSCVRVGCPRRETGGRVEVASVLPACGRLVSTVVAGAPVAEVVGGGATTVLTGPPEPGGGRPAGGPPALAIPEVAVAIAANSVATPRPEAASCPWGRQSRGIRRPSSFRIASVNYDTPMMEVSSHAGHGGGGSPARVRLTARVRGRVQGVGFRAWTRFRAEARGLAGSARNTADGSVEIVAEGGQRDCRALLDELRGGAAPGRVAEVTEEWSSARGDVSGFAEL